MTSAMEASLVTSTLAAMIIDAAGKGCKIIEQQVAGDDARAVICQRSRDGLADAARGSRHDCSASVEPDEHGLRSFAYSAQFCPSGFLQAPDHGKRNHRRRQKIEIGRRHRRSRDLDEPAMNGANPPKMATASA